MRYKRTFAFLALAAFFVIVLVSAFGLSIVNRGGRTWLGANFVCKQVERGFSYSTGWPVTNHQAEFFIPYATINANILLDTDGDSLTVKRVKECVGVAPKYMPGRVDRDSLTIEQWQVEGEGLIGLKRLYPEASDSFTLYLPAGDQVGIRQIADIDEVVVDVLPKSKLVIIANLSTPNTIVYSYRTHSEFRYNVDWDAINGLAMGGASIQEPLATVRH